MSVSASVKRRWLAAAAGAANLAAVSGALAAGLQAQWPAFEGGPASTHYSPLAQINRTTVKDLQPAWSYKLGASLSSCEPLVIDDRLIVIGPGSSIAALDPGDGRELWRTAPETAGRSTRGFAYWRSPDGRDERVLFVSGRSIRALDPKTGSVIADFEIDLRQGLDREPARIRAIAPATPGRVFANLLIVGSITGEDYESSPGDVRAFDVRTGRLVWSFHTIPRPGEPGHETWPKDAWTYGGGANNWGGMTLDEPRAIAYFVTGSAVSDFYGGDRKGDNLYANSLIAVDARTGKRLWHFQAVHHDLWDYDLVASPTLLTVRRQGKSVPAIALASKHGFLFVFDRVTGKPLYPIVEKPVPASDMPGEFASSTQPFSSLPPFARQSFTETDLDPALPEEQRQAWIKRLRAARNDGLFTPPSVNRETVQMPGNHGGANWGQTGAAPGGRYFVTSYDLPAMLKLVAPLSPQELERIAAQGGRGAAVYAQSCQLCHGADMGGQGGAPSLRGMSNRVSEADIRRVVRAGRATMPAFPQMSAEDLDAVVTYVRSEGRTVVAANAARGRPTLAATSPNGATRYRSAFNLEPLVIKPPWQTLTAYDLNTGRILWRAPIGTPPGRKEATGQAQEKGGLLITAGGLVMVGSEADRKLHAYDADTGQELWAGSLPSHPRGGIVTYMHRGRQYVVAPTAFGGAFPTLDIPGSAPGENAYVAFALPARSR